jgi:phosphoribosylglycinamide formyltransferase 2
MVTLISQNLTEFDLHARAILGLPIPSITQHGPSASAVILAERDATDFTLSGLEAALRPSLPGVDVDVRIFNKPTTRPYRRMGVALALARSGDTDAARTAARTAAARVEISYHD